MIYNEDIELLAAGALAAVLGKHAAFDGVYVETTVDEVVTGEIKVLFLGHWLSLRPTACPPPPLSQAWPK